MPVSLALALVLAQGVSLGGASGAAQIQVIKQDGQEWVVIHEPTPSRWLETRLQAKCGTGEIEIEYSDDFGNNAQFIDIKINGSPIPRKDLNKLRRVHGGRSIAKVSFLSCSDPPEPYSVKILIQLSPPAGSAVATYISAKVSAHSVQILP